MRLGKRTASEPGTAHVERPTPPHGARHLVVVVLDSLRYDSWVAAAPTALGRIGPVERRFSYASWTAPSHYNLLMGLLPHSSPTGVVASDYYRRDFRRYEQRLGVSGVDFPQFLPSLWLPDFLGRSLGYRSRAFVSMPVLNPRTPLNRGFDDYVLMPKHNDMAAMLALLQFDDGPSFHLLNVGETHYPYAPPDEDSTAWPTISGLHGTLKRLTDDGGDEEPDAPPFDAATLRTLRDRQVDAVRYVDGVFERLYDLLPDDTWLIVTSDHGELFGEDGFFGHGPINHEKVLEVPFVEGAVPR